MLKADKAVGVREGAAVLFKTCQSIGFPGVSLQVIDKAGAQ